MEGEAEAQLAAASLLKEEQDAAEAHRAKQEARRQKQACRRAKDGAKREPSKADSSAVAAAQGLYRPSQEPCRSAAYEASAAEDFNHASGPP